MTRVDQYSLLTKKDWISELHFVVQHLVFRLFLLELWEIEMVGVLSVGSVLMGELGDELIHLIQGAIVEVLRLPLIQILSLMKNKDSLLRQRQMLPLLGTIHSAKHHTFQLPRLLLRLILFKRKDGIRLDIILSGK